MEFAFGNISRVTKAMCRICHGKTDSILYSFSTVQCDQAGQFSRHSDDINGHWKEHIFVLLSCRGLLYPEPVTATIIDIHPLGSETKVSDPFTSLYAE